MKLLTKKKQEEVVRKLADIQFLITQHMDDFDAYSAATDGVADIVVSMGRTKVLNAFKDQMRYRLQSIAEPLDDVEEEEEDP